MDPDPQQHPADASAPAAAAGPPDGGQESSSESAADPHAAPGAAPASGPEPGQEPGHEPGPDGGSVTQVLKSPFRWLFYAAVTSSLGDWIGLAAIIVLTKTLTAGDGGASRATLFSLSGVMIARILPTMLLGPVAGVFADRWDRRRLLISADVGRALVFFAVPFAQDVWALFLATIIIEVMATLFIPVKDAIVPTLVPKNQLVQANQLNLLATYGTLPLGGFAFAAVVVASGAAVGDATGWQFVQERPESIAIWLNAFTFLLSAWFVSRIPGISGRGNRLATGSDERPGAWQEFVEGFRFLAGHPLIRSLVFGIMAACMAAGTVIAIGVAFAQVLNAGDDGFGILQGVVGTGLVLGILATGWLERRFPRERLFAPGVLLAGIALVVTALMPRLDLAMVTALIMGFGGGVAFLTGYTLLQESVTDDMRGRTFGAFNTAVRFSIFVSLVVAPLIVGVIGTEPQTGGVTQYAIGGVRITLILSGVIAILGGGYSGLAVRRVTDHGGIDRVVPRAMKGLFVVFEGGDGSGKTTQIRLLRDALVAGGIEPVVTREPGGTVIGERIRELVLDPDNAGMSDRTEAMLYAAARAQHVDEVIAPALADNRIVIGDRYVDSSIVYQGVARGLGAEDVRRLNRWGTDNIGPDLVILLDVPADEGLRRAGHEPDRLEGAGLDFHETVNEAFRRLAVLTPERYLTVDATQPKEEVHRIIVSAVRDRLRLPSLPDLPEPDIDDGGPPEDGGDREPDRDGDQGAADTPPPTPAQPPPPSQPPPASRGEQVQSPGGDRPAAPTDAGLFRSPGVHDPSARR